MIPTALSQEPTATYELPLAREYVRHWGLKEAVRELLQNAIDSDSPFEHTFEGDALTITSRLASLEPSTLVLGTTSKAEDDGKIGSFGEGYKIALLVLARLGYPVHVLNDGRLWTPTFRRSTTFGAEVLCIEERPFICTGLSFVVSGLTDEDIDAIRGSCLLMQEPVTDAIETLQGNILPSHPGKLYVSGLFVCDTQLAYGYDIRPKYLRLERDRQTVSTFDLQWLTKDMWFATQQFDRVAEMITADVPDVKYAEHGCPELLKEACYQAFIKQHPGGVIAKSPEDLQQLVARGMKKTVYINQTLHACVSGAKSYQPTLAKAKEPTPAEALTQWFEANRKYMRRMPIVAFKQLLSASGAWRAR